MGIPMLASSKRVLALSLICTTLLVSGCSSPEQKEARYIKRGNELFDDGKYEKARIEYKNAMRLKPTDPEPVYRTGLIEEAEGNLRDAFNAFGRAMQQDAQYHPAILKLAEYYMVAGQYDQAQQYIDTVLHDTPDDNDTHALHAALLYRQKNLSGAETEAQAVLAKDPANVVATSVLTTLYSSQGNEAKAISTVESGIAKNPKNLSLLLLESSLYEKSGNLDKVTDLYTHLFTAAPAESKYRVKLALIQADAKQVDAAEKTLRDGITALPDDWELRHQLVQFLSKLRSMEASEQEIRAIIAEHPEKPEPYSWLADLYLSHGTLDRAESTLNDILAHSRSDQQAMAVKASLARINYAKGDRQAARTFAAEALAKDPNNLEALFIRARLEADDGSYLNATADLRSILRDRPHATQALNVLAEVLMKEHHLDLAIETLNQLVDTDPLDISARVRLAQLYHINKNPRHAMDILFTVTKLEPNYPLAWETTARAAMDLKDWDTAKMAIDKLEPMEGQKDIATYLRGQLFAHTDKTAEAVTAFQAVVNANPTSAIAEQALTALVTLQNQSGHIKEATAYLASLKTDSPFVKTLLGEAYMFQNQPDLATAAFDAAIASHASEPEPYLERAKLYVIAHNNDQALATLAKAEEVAPADPRALVMQAEIITKLGNYKEAEKIYTSILEKDPDLDVIANNLAEIIADNDYSDAASLDKARTVAERFAVSPNPLFLDTLAWVYFRQGHIDLAQALMDRAANMKATLPAQFHYHYGAILLKAKNPTQAKTELIEATVQGADYPGVEDARKLLSGL